jgi:hypothetical protein
MIIALLNSTIGYNDHLDDHANILVDGTWYACKIRNLPDIEHLLSVHPVRDGKINVRFDTGRCGSDALASDLRWARFHLADCGATVGSYRGPAIYLQWDPQIGNDGTRLFYGGFTLLPKRTSDEV